LLGYRLGTRRRSTGRWTGGLTLCARTRRACCQRSATLVQLLTATAPKVREKAATVLCLLAESGIPEEEETHGRSGSIIVISCCSTIRSIKILLVVSYGK